MRPDILEAGRSVMPFVMSYLEHDFWDEDEEELSWQKITVNMDEYRQLGDSSFRRHFGLTKPVFESLYEDVGNHIRDTGRWQRERRPLSHMILMVLWILATPDSFRSVALRFGVYPSEVHSHYKCLIVAIRELGPRFITWPNEEERNRIKTDLQRISGFPGVVGMVDGTHISISFPVIEAAAHRNRHHGHSILAQAVCDDRLLIRDLYVGEAGSLHDARVFRRSPLLRNFLQRPDMLNVDEHIVGDSAYMLMDKVMTPFERIGNLQPLQTNYNRALSRCRVRIESAFGRAKLLWRRLRYLHMRNMDCLVDHIIASFVLHNYIILHGEEFPIGEVVENEDDDVFFGPNEQDVNEIEAHGVRDIIPDPHAPQGDLARELGRAVLRGEQKRWDICNNLAMAAN